MKTSSVALDNSGVLTVNLGREASLVTCSTDKRCNCWLEDEFFYIIPPSLATSSLWCRPQRKHF